MFTTSLACFTGLERPKGQNSSVIVNPCPATPTGVVKHTTTYLQGYYGFSSGHFREQYPDVPNLKI